MENVLERAVQHAADMMRRRLQAVTPDVLALAGAPRAQGFRIDGYGLFFSVEVPRLSESVNWALRVLSQDSDERVLASLQKVATSEEDPVLRADLERAMRTIQMQLATIGGSPAGGSASPTAARQGTSPAASSVVGTATPPAFTTSGAPAPGAASVAAADHVVASGSAESSSASSSPPAAPQVATLSPAPVVAPPETPVEQTAPRDPSVVYEDEVKQALVDAVLDYAGSLQLPPAEWVTVAARDAGYVAFPDAVSDMVTVTLSVRVSDLVDFRAQRLTRDEARARVVIREF